MVEGDVGFYRDCREWRADNPETSRRLALCGAAIFLILLAIGSFLFIRYDQYSAPYRPELIGVTTTPDGHGGAILSMEYHATLSDNCLTLGLHLMRLDRPGQKSRYWSASSSMRGGGLKGSVSDFFLDISVPPGLQSGDWKLINRLDSSCPPLRLRFFDQTSQPVTIRVNGDQVSVPEGQWFNMGGPTWPDTSTVAAQSQPDIQP